MKRCLLPVVAWLAIAGTLSAEIKSKPIAYQDGDLQLEGYYAWDDAVSGKELGIDHRSHPEPESSLACSPQS